MAWTTLHLEVVTPLFSGDDPDGEAVVRVPSVRGALRFWLRAVAAGRCGWVRQEDLPRLWALEESVFGSTNRPSPIGLRITEQPTTSDDRFPKWTQNGRPKRFDGAQYLLGQGLWSYREGLSRPFVAEGTPLRLDVRFSSDPATDARFMMALWAWLAYGGLGARTRRGYGQLRCVEVDGKLPNGWSAGLLAAPRSWRAWEVLGERCFPTAAPWDRVDWGAEPGATGGLAEHPALGAPWWSGRIVGLNAETVGEALHEAGADWRRFRAGPDAELDEDDLPCPDTRSPEWQHVIHDDGKVYPVAALGLPVNYFSPAKSTGRAAFKANVSPEGPRRRTSDPKAELRRASPIWLRPVRANGKWQLFTFVFRSRLLPDGAALELSNPRKRLTTPSVDDCEQAWANWLDGQPRLPPGTDLRKT